MEVIAEDRVLDGNLLSIVVRNFDLFVLDNLIRRHKFETPIPVGLAQILRRLDPIGLIRSELLSNFDGSSLKYLLKRTVKLRKFACTRNIEFQLPRTQKGTFYAKSGTEPAHGYNNQPCIGSWKVALWPTQ